MLNKLAFAIKSVTKTLLIISGGISGIFTLFKNRFSKDQYVFGLVFGSFNFSPIFVKYVSFDVVIKSDSYSSYSSYIIKT